MRSTLTTLLMLFCIQMLVAQTARVQIIHNSPAPTVDIYVNGDLFLNDFVFRTATPFVDVPADVNLDIAVAPGNSASVDDAIATFPATLAADETYVVVATGVVGGNPGFDLAIFDMGQETVGDDNIGLLFYHGSPDAPAVDITTGGAPIFDDVSYGDFQGYLEVPAASYELAVTPAADNSNVLAAYNANLGFWRGRTAVVFASGFLSGDNPAFEPWVALDNGGTFPLTAIPVPGPDLARVQIIHNAPDPVVDIYVNGDLFQDDFEFRTATPFVDVPAGVNLDIAIAPGNSMSVMDAIATFPVTLDKDKTYVVVATGIVGGNPGFDLAIFDMGQESASAGNVGILFYHGSPDAPGVDIVTGGAPIIDDVSYGEFQGYLEVPAASYDLSVTPDNDNTNIIQTYVADVSGLGGGAAVVFASGFLSGMDPAFEPWVALPDGTTFPLPVKGPDPELARVQIIHNAPNPTVDIYANGDLLLDNFVFRTATPYIDVPANVNITIGVAPSTSTSAADAIANFDVTLEDGASYVVVATGIVGGNPGFDLAIFDMGMETADTEDNIGILFYHGSPDAPEVDIIAGGSPIFDDVSYGEFSGYLNVPATSYVLGVTPGNDNTNIIEEYDANLGFWAGRTAVVFASGFLTGGTPTFEPWVALDNGGTFPLLPATSSLVGGNNNRMANPLNAADIDLAIAPNPAQDRTLVSFNLPEDAPVTLTVVNVNGQVMQQHDLGTTNAGLFQHPLETTNYPTGLYFIQLITPETVITQKLMIEQF